LIRVNHKVIYKNKPTPQFYLKTLVSRYLTTVVIHVVKIIIMIIINYIAITY
jgi:hypothetical protein